MNRQFAPLFLILAFLLSACAVTTTGSPTRLAVPDEEARQLAFRQAESQRREFRNVLLKLDQAMESYARAMANRGVARADLHRGRLEKLIEDLVLDQGAKTHIKRANADGSPEVFHERPIGDNFHRLQAAAIDGKQGFHQGIALAALGFSGREDMMPTILQGAQLEDPLLVDRAVFGLAMLRAPATPPGVLAAVVENTELPVNSRTQAAWALYRIQSQSSRLPEIVEIWQRYTTNLQETLPPGVIVQSVRGLGLTRDEKHAEIVVPLLRHRTALVRMAAADALARMNAQLFAEDLIDLLGPSESSPNVRLHARKALQALAGRADYGYDVAAWRKAFERK